MDYLPSEERRKRLETHSGEELKKGELMKRKKKWGTELRGAEKDKVSKLE